jgi:hypothetical protein
VQEYYAAGQFTTKGRLMQSLRANLKFYLILAAPLVLGLIYIIASKSVELPDLIPFLFTVANTFGLCLIFLVRGLHLSLLCSLMCSPCSLRSPCVGCHASSAAPC